MEKGILNIAKIIRKRIKGTELSSAEQRQLSAYSDEFGSLAFGDYILPIREVRSSLQAGTPGSGAEVVGTDISGLIAPIRSHLATLEAGATMLTGLVGDVKLPIYAGSTAKWKGEGVSSDDGAGAFSKLELKPKRITTHIDVSKQFLLQDSAECEAMLLDDLGAAVSAKFESTIFGKEAGTINQPAGIFNTIPTIKGTANRDNILSLEKGVTFKDRLRAPAYLTNADGRDVLKATPKMANQPLYLMEPDGSMNCHKVIITNNITSGLQAAEDEHGIIFADWSQLILGFWAVGIIVDEYSQALLDNVKITINAYVDSGWRFANSYKTGSLK